MTTTSQPESDHTYEQGDRAEDLARYWTPDRRATATPVEPPVLPPEELARYRVHPTGDDALPSVLAIPSGDPALTGGPPHPVDPNVRPYWNAGKLFFTGDDGKDYVGSASFVGTPNVVMTAAHCVRSGTTGAWYRNFLFVRAAVGHWWGWSGQDVYVDRVGAWMMYIGPNYAYDYAFLHTTTTSGAGYLGLTTGIPYAAFTSVGYPSNYAGGNEMYAADGTRGPVYGGIVRMDNNPMGPGCSGGPWIGDVSHDYKPTANIACGLNSFGYASEPNAMYGPLFDGTTIQLYNCIATGGSC